MKMKQTALFLILSLFIVSTLDLTASFATGYQGYQKMNLPEGAEAHVGKGLIQEVRYSPDGNKLAVAGRGGVWIYNAHNGQELALLSRGYSNDNQCLFSVDGRTAVTIGRWNGQNGATNLYLWDTTTWQHKMTLTSNLESYYSANSIALSPDGNRLAACVDTDLVLWDVTTGKSTRFIGDYGQLNAVAFSPDGNTLASGGQYGRVLVWDITTKRKTVSEDEAGHVIDSIEYSPDGDTLATVNWSGELLLWDTATVKVKTELTDVKLQNALDAGSSWIKAFGIKFSPDGRTLASSHYSANTVLLWNITTKKVETTFSGRFIGFSSDGSTIAIIHDPIIELWDTATGKRKTRLNLGGGWRSDLGDFAFSPDGSTIAISGRWNTGSSLELWDVVSGERRATLSQEYQAAIMFSPNGDILASWVLGTGILLWEVPALSEPSIPTDSLLHPPMYWISGEIGTLHRLTGTKVEHLVPDVQNATGLALDVVGRKLYWIEKTSDRSGRIQRASLDGSNIQLVKELTSVPHGIAIDAVNLKLYVTNSRGKIQRLNLDGSNFEPNLITGLNAPKYVALDIDGGKLYWTENSRRVRRANLNGSNVERFIKTSGEVGGIAVAGDKVYWAEIINKTWGRVNYANFNGSNVESLVGIPYLPDVPPGIAIDPDGSKLYLPMYYSDTSEGGIWRINLNEENYQRLIYGLEMVGPIVIDISSENPAH